MVRKTKNRKSRNKAAEDETTLPESPPPSRSMISRAGWAVVVAVIAFLASGLAGQRIGSSGEKLDMTTEATNSNHSSLQGENEDASTLPENASHEMDEEQLRDLAKFLSQRNAPKVPTTLVSVAAYHDYHKEGQSQKETMIEYLHYDDGYTTCIALSDLKTDPSVAQTLQLKHSKFLHLQRMANHPERWTVSVPEGIEPTEVDESIFEDVLPTCRLITLTVGDMDGSVNQILKEALVSNETEPYIVDSFSSSAHEFRTMACLARLIDEFLRRISDPKQRAAMESLKQRWASNAATARERALHEPLPPLPDDWVEYRNEKSNGHAYYVNRMSGTKTWIRPVPDFRQNPREIAAPPTLGDDGQPLKNAALIVRNKPCDAELSKWMLGNQE